MIKSSNEQLKKYERLGALRFQKFVFYLERQKYRLIKKYSPNYLKKYEKKCDALCKGALECASSEEERRQIQAYYRREKMLLRKELFQEKNRNYHLNMKRPTEIVNYLKQNKAIHTGALRLDGLCTAIGTTLTALGIVFFPPVAIIGGIMTTISLSCAFLNFQCINLQNYNLCRLELKKEQLARLEARQKQKEEQEYAAALNLIHKVEDSSSNVAHIPTAEEIINNITTKEQAEQMKKILLAAKKEHMDQSLNNINNTQSQGSIMKTLNIGGIKC